MSPAPVQVPRPARAQVVLADDHELFREGLANLINAQSDLAVAGQAGDGLEALTLARDLRPDLIVMDIQMPVCSGLEATRLIRAAWPEARIVMLTIHDEDEKLFEAIRSGASGYLLKDTRSAEFLRGIRGALAGEAALPPRLAARLLAEFVRLANRPAANTPEPDLTARELQVLQLIATGAADKEIAERLALSLHTVKTHVRSILSKLHAVNRREAARLAAQAGWVKR
ncbi:MAG: response regulator transcription factor [Anaerolineales bacterium]|nr:response regulator transcription factor [Anaerolineales bacterium]